MARLADMDNLQSGVTVLTTSTGHLVFKPVVQNRSTKPPESAYLYAGDLTITGHFLERLRMNFEKSRGLIAIEKFLKGQFSNPNAADRFARNIGHRDLQVVFMQRGAASAA